MPEGPEVRREADRIAGALVGKPIEQIEFGIPRLQLTFTKPRAVSRAAAVGVTVVRGADGKS